MTIQGTIDEVLQILMLLEHKYGGEITVSALVKMRNENKEVTI